MTTLKSAGNLRADTLYNDDNFLTFWKDKDKK